MPTPIAGAELGITWAQPYGGWSYYISDAQYTENPKFAPLIARLFPRVRMINPVGYGGAGTTYPNNSTLSTQIWASYLKTNFPDTYILYGANNNHAGFNPVNYPIFSTYLQEEAAWAEENLMDAFCIGNENLIGASHTNGGVTITSLSRTSNVVTVEVTGGHGLTTDDYIFVSGGDDASFRVADSTTLETTQVTVIDSDTFTYPSTGSDGTPTGTYKYNWSALETVRKTKALGVICQAIFTRGPIQYSESQGWTDPWITEGITPGTDIDLWGLNGYGDGSNGDSAYRSWKTEIDACFAEFGEAFIITEHNVVQDSGNPKVFNFNHENKGAEYWFDKEFIRRYEYLLSLGVSQIYIYGTTEYGFFANTWTSTDFDNAYYTGDFKQLIYSLVFGGRDSRKLLGTNEST